LPGDSPQPWWRQLVSQYFVPTAVASIIASALSVYTAINAQHQQARQFNAEFEKLITGAAIVGAFKGGEAGEQQAAENLLALQAMAETSAQKASVLLTGARLLNANTDSESTGAPAARLLTILIDQDERSGDKSLMGLTRSQPFLDLVTAGYSNDYYNDNPKLDWYLWPTLNGDQPITHDAKLLLLSQLTPERFEGWIYVATFSTAYDFSNTLPGSAAPSPAPVTAGAGVEQAPAQLSTGTALSFLDALEQVSLRRDLGRARNSLSQYAIEVPKAHAAATPAAGAEQTPVLFGPKTLMEAADLPASLLMLKPRLLRSRPPVEFVNPDGTFHKGSLGRIIGAVRAGTCVSVVEPLQPTLVFVTSPLSDHIPGAKRHDWIGLVHMWAHVQPSATCPFRG
jgi:hypothetical protein